MEFNNIEDAIDAFKMLGYGRCTPNLGCKSKIPIKPCLVSPTASAGLVCKTETVGLLPDNAHVIVFDTETTGLTGSIVQLAYDVYSAEGNRLKSFDRLLCLPRGETISWAAFKVHKISKFKVQREGKNATREIELFVARCREVISKGGRVVAHNADFDVRALAQTVRNHGSKKEVACLVSKEVFCTMRESKGKIAVYGKNGKKKTPSNVDLFKYLSNDAKVPDNLHDAAVDIGITAKSFFLGVRRGWWAVGTTTKQSYQSSIST